jgi:hypothetical protein
MATQLPVTERWYSRDFPVLLEAARMLDAGNQIDESQVAATLGIDATQVYDAIADLRQSDYLDDSAAFTMPGTRGASMAMPTITRLTERGRRAVGIWPNEEQAGDQLLWILEQKVEHAGSGDEKSKWQRIRDAVAGAGRDFAVELGAAMAARSLGG